MPHAIRRRGTRRSLGIAGAAAAAVAASLALAGPADAATTTPLKNDFNGGTQGWSSADSCDGLGVTTLDDLLCARTSSHEASGLIEFRARTVLSANGITALESTLTEMIDGGSGGLLDGLIGGVLDGLLGGVFTSVDDLVDDLAGGLGLGSGLSLHQVFNDATSHADVLETLQGLIGTELAAEGLDVLGLLEQLNLDLDLDLPFDPRGTWTSADFQIPAGDAPTDARLQIDRKALIGPLVNIGGSATVSVYLEDVTDGGALYDLFHDDPIVLSAVDADFTTETSGNIAGALTPGHTYRLHVNTAFSSMVGVMAESTVQYDNVQLAATVDTGSTAPPPPPPPPDGSGPNDGSGNDGTGAGGLGPCEADLSVPEVESGDGGDPSKVSLSARQLLINQRISQAGVRRVNTAIDALTAGLTGDSFRDCSVGPQDFAPGLVAQVEGGAAADPPSGVEGARPTPTRPSDGGDPGKVGLTRQQLLINQRISQAAVRRVNAVRERLDGNITAGDIRQGVLGAATLDTAGRATFDRALPAGPAVGQEFQALETARRGGGDPGAVRLTREQLLINQRISQAAVRRVNQVRAEMEAGLTGANIKDGSLGRANLTPQVQMGAK